MREIDRIILKYPNRIPVLVYPKNDYQPKIDKNKFLVPKDLIILNLIHVIRARLKNIIYS